MKKVALHNLGCKVNSYEIEVMQQQLVEAGYEIVPFEDRADVYVVNTCSVTNIADRKSRQMLHKAKKENPEAIIVAAGCYVQTRPSEEILADGVDLLLGNNKKSELISMLENYFKDAGDSSEPVAEANPSNSNVIDINHTNEYENMLLTEAAEHTRAYIKVQDGCNQFCSYCIIPFARGRVRSRAMESVEEEIRGLTAKGYREFVLTGIHLSSYGLDFAPEDAEDKNNWLVHSRLIELIERISKIQGVCRIRLGSLEPRIVTEEFANRLAAIPQMCPHFHLSLQSGCDETLKRMNRHYSAEEYYEGVVHLRRAFVERLGAEPAITTDIIVGFPGEDEAEFDASYAFAQKVAFYETHIFKYSKRKGTRAALMPNQLTEKVKTERSQKLLALNDYNKKAYTEKLCSSNYLSELLVEESVDIDGVIYQVGYTREYIRAAFVSDENLTGRIVTGRLKMSDIVESGNKICNIYDIGVKL